MDPKELQQIEEYLKASGLRADELLKRMDAIKASATEFNRELINAQNASAKINNSFDDLSAQFKNIVDDLRKWDSTSSLINRSYKTLGGISDKLKYDAQDISRLSKKDLESLDKKAQIELSALKTRKEELDLAIKSKFQNLSNEQITSIGLRTKDKNLAKQISQYNELNQTIDEQGNLIDDVNNPIKTLLDKTKERLKEEETINKTLGITGKLVDGIVGTLGKLGIESSFFENLKEDMRDAAKSGDRWAVVSTATKGIFKGIGEALTDPIAQLTILVKLANFFTKAALTANVQSVGLGKQLGYGAERADALREKMVAIESSSKNSNVTTASLTQAFGELAEATGFAYEFSADQLETQIMLTKEVGLTGAEAANIQKFSLLTGKTSEETYKSFVKGLNATSKQLKVGINFKATLAEALKVSGQLSANLGNDPIRIAKAIVQAKAFGMTLDEVAKSGESLLNFESSIESELKAELLTGKQLNLERARAAALSGDQVTLAAEIAANIGTSADFAKMNVLQQKALAEAVGMTADQLANTLVKREQAIKSGKTLAQVTAEEKEEALKRQDIQTKFNAAVEKLQSIFGNLMAGPLGSFIDLLSDALNLVNYMATPLKIIGGLYLAIKTTLLAINAAKKIGLGYDLITSKGGISNVVKDKLKGVFSRGIADKGSDITKDAQGKFRDAKGRFAKAPGVDKAGDIAGKAKSTNIPQSGTKGGGMIESLSKIDTKALLRGAAAMLVASAAIYVFGKAVQELEKVKDWTNVAIGLGAFAVSMGILGAIGPYASTGLTALAGGLTTFGAAMLTGLPALGLAALVATAIGLGFALKLAAPAIEAFGKGIATIFDSLENVDVAKMLAIGPALIGIGIGLASLGAGGVIAAIGSFLGGDPIKKLERIATSGDGLIKAATGLKGMASGLSQMSAALSALDISKLDTLSNFSPNKSLIIGTNKNNPSPIKEDNKIKNITPIKPIQPIKEDNKIKNITPIKPIQPIKEDNKIKNTSPIISEKIMGENNKIKNPTPPSLGKITGENNKINNMDSMIAAINEVRAEVTKLANRPISINLDGKKVGSGLTQGSYKVA